MDATAASEETIIRLVRDDSNAEIQLSQINPRSVSSLFTIDINSVFLKEVGGSRAFFPDSTNSSFRFTSDVGTGIRSFYVEGTTSTAESSSLGSVVSATFPHHQTGVSGTSGVGRFRSSYGEPSPRPIFTSKKNSMTDTSFNLKIIQAKVSFGTSGPNGKPSFENLGQTFVCIHESTATVPYLRSVVREKWGEMQVLVTSDALPIDDSDGTRGLKFWKVPSRRVYSVSGSDLKVGKGKSTRSQSKWYLESEDDLSDFDIPRSSKKKTKVMNENSMIMQELKEMRSELQSVVKVTKCMKFPPGLYSSIITTFKCNLCLCLITPPVIFARCCKNLLGCEKCVNNLYHGENGPTVKCPLCRAERGFSETCRVNGIDSFLTSLGPMLDLPTSNDDNSDIDDYNFP